MENFFKAHSNKKVKSKNKLKNKIRLMLNGYEKNDRDAIRDAAEQTKDESDLDFFCDDISEKDLPTVEREESLCSVSSANDIPENSYSTILVSQPQSNVYKKNTNKELEVQHCSNSATIDENSSHDTDEEFNGNSANNGNSTPYVCIEDSEEVSETGSDKFSISIQSSSSSSLLAQSVNEDEGQINERENSEMLEHCTSTEPYFSDEDSIDQKLDNVSLELTSSFDTPNVSSSSAEFDHDGRLASIIFKKLNPPNKQKSKQYECQTVPSGSGYIKNKITNNSEKKNYVAPKNSNKRFKIKKNIKELYTIDASKEELQNFPLSFKDYNFSTTKNITQKSVNFAPKGPIFKPVKLNDVQINHCPVDLEPILESSVDETDQNLISVADTSLGVNCNGSSSIVVEDNVTGDEDQKNGNEYAKIKFIQVNNGILAIMSHPSTMFFHGKANVKSLCGTVEVLGFTLDGNFTEIYAPRSNFAQKLSTKAIDCSHYGLFSKLTSVGLPVLKTEDVVITIKEYDAILYFEQLNNQCLDFIENEFGGLEMFHMSKKTLSYEEHPEVALKLNCSLYTCRPYKSFEEIPDWPEIVKHSKGVSSKGIVCGGQGTGKSTFLKYYINARISETPVVVIDLDPGQAEFTVPGNVSVSVVSKPVIGPNFTHLIKPKRMLNVGLINVMQNIERYVSAITEIIQYVKHTEEYADLPWIVNTMGMNNSIGLKLLTYTILLLRPTFLVQMDSNMPNKCFKIVLDSREIKTLYSEYEEDSMFDGITVPENFNYRNFVSSPVKQAPRENITAKDKRYFCFLAYFGKLLRKGVDNLLSVRPYVIQLSSINILTNCRVQEDAITSVINGKIVAMCENNTSITGNTFAMEENALLCLGFGLIRGVDLDTASVYVVCVEPSEAMSRVNVLLYCDCYPELMLSDAGLPPATPVPYRAPLRPHNRQFFDTPKRRFNPLQLLKIKRSQQKC